MNQTPIIHTGFTPPIRGSVCYQWSRNSSAHRAATPVRPAAPIQPAFPTTASPRVCGRTCVAQKLSAEPTAATTKDPGQIFEALLIRTWHTLVEPALDTFCVVQIAAASPSRVWIATTPAALSRISTITISKVY